MTETTRMVRRAGPPAVREAPQPVADAAGRQSEAPHAGFYAAGPMPGLTLRLMCACGGKPGPSGGCEGCAQQRETLEGENDAAPPGRMLRPSLAVGATDDPVEREADRVAERVTAAPGVTPPSVRRDTGHAGGPAGAAPASVDRALAGPGGPLEPALRRDMERRFGRDFSGVRVHSGAAAEQSARDVNAHAYTVGQDIVFGAGRYAPRTHPGQRLLAHELTHVAQQAGADPVSSGRPAGPTAPVLRREPARPPGGPQVAPSIVMIVAYRGSKASATATLSDGTVEPVTLSKNTLEQGEYTFGKDDSPLHYRRVSGPLGGDFIWNKKRRYQWADTVQVIIRLTPEEKIDALPSHIRDFLTTTKSGAAKASAQDLQSIAAAGRILETYGVTPDELSLLELAQADKEGVGIHEEEATDVVAWALAFVERREAGRSEAEGTRRTLLECAARHTESAHRLQEEEWWRPPSPPADPAQAAKEAEEYRQQGRSPQEPWYSREHQRAHETRLRQRKEEAECFGRALDVEVRAVAAMILNVTEAAIYRTDRRYIGAYQPQSLGPGFVWQELQELRADGEIQKLRAEIRHEEAWEPPRQPEDSAKAAREAEEYRQQGRSPPEPYYSREHKRAHENSLRKMKAELVQLVQEKSRRRRESTSQGDAPPPPRLEVAGLLGANIEKFLGAKTSGDAYNTLADILYRARTAVRAARRHLDDPSALYGADIVIATEKALLGALPGTHLDRIIDEIAGKRTSKKIWEEILEIVTIVVGFIPGPIGLALRTAAATVGAVRSVNRFATQGMFHRAGLQSVDPSAASLATELVVTTAGVVLDVATTKMPTRRGMGLDLGEPPPPTSSARPPAGGGHEPPVPPGSPSGGGPATEIRGVPTGDAAQSIMIRPAPTPATLTRAEVDVLRNTETKVLERRATLAGESERLAKERNGINEQIKRRDALLGGGTLSQAGEDNVRTQLADLERQWRSKQAKILWNQKRLQALEAELAHTQSQLRGTYTSEQVFAELEQELAQVPAATGELKGTSAGGFKSPKPLPPGGPPAIQTPKGTTVRESQGAKPRAGDFQSASAADPAAVNTAIRADVAEAEAYKWSLGNGEIGLQRPRGANVIGGDFITAAERPDGLMEVIVTDTKSSGVPKFPTPAGPADVPGAWMAEARAAVEKGRLNLGDAVLEDKIRAAVQANPPRVRVRQVNVDYSPAGGGKIAEKAAPKK